MADESVRGGEYRQSDVEIVFRRGDWRDWDDAIHWLEAEGEGDYELTEEEVNAMAEDFRKLEQQGVPFSNDPAVVFEELSRHYESG